MTPGIEKAHLQGSGGRPGRRRSSEENYRQFNMDEKSTFWTVDLPIELLNAERANRAKSQRSSPYLESNSPGTFASSRNTLELFLGRTIYPLRIP
jgi:hypothetical protein